MLTRQALLGKGDDAELDSEQNILLVHFTKNQKRFGRGCKPRPARVSTMRKEYDFSDSVKNPYFQKLDKQVTVELDDNTLAYFQQLSEQNGIPYQSLITLYLRDCALQHRQLSIK